MRNEWVLMEKPSDGGQEGNHMDISLCCTERGSLISEMGNPVSVPAVLVPVKGQGAKFKITEIS